MTTTLVRPLSEENELAHQEVVKGVWDSWSEEDKLKFVGFNMNFYYKSVELHPGFLEKASPEDMRTTLLVYRVAFAKNNMSSPK